MGCCCWGLWGFGGVDVDHVQIGLDERAFMRREMIFHRTEEYSRLVGSRYSVLQVSRFEQVLFRLLLSRFQYIPSGVRSFWGLLRTANFLECSLLMYLYLWSHFGL